MMANLKDILGLHLPLMEYQKRYRDIVKTLLLLLLVGSSYEITATEVEPHDLAPQPID